ncbi:MAG: hypothetical protein ACREF7_04185 [Candidatus Saccharimonadales bacterium]
MIKQVKRYLYLALALFLVLAIASLDRPAKSSAAEIEPRSLTLQAGATDGGSDPGGVVNHLFQITVPTSTAIQSIEFHYCTVASGTCGTLTGLSTTSATIGAATSAALSGFTLDNTTNADPYLTSASAYTPAANTALTVQLDTVTNPTAANSTFYVQITTWSGPNEGGSAVDTGTVAAAVVNPIQLSGTMPESLVFCTGATVGETSGVPDCTTATAGTVSFTTLFSPTYTSTATSQMAASTNAGSGYAITVNGATLTNGSYTIAAMGSTAAAPIHGVSQFGMNLVANTTATATPAPGTDITPTSDGSNYYAFTETNYGTVDEYAYNTGDTIANSGYPTGTPAVGTDAQIYTATYIVDVPGKQPAGSYDTTLTYICTPTF